MSIDNSSLINNQNAVASDILYNLKNSAGTSRRYRASLPPTNGSVAFLPGAQIIFSIPSGRKNTYLDGQNRYLRLTIKNFDGTNSMTLDNTGACSINMLTVNLSGNLIDQCPNYNLLFNYITDFLYDLGSHNGMLSAYLGTSSTFTSNGDVVASMAGATIAAATAGTTVIGSFTSESFVATRSGYTIPASGLATVCLPRLWGIFLNSDKMIPLGKLKR